MRGWKNISHANGKQKKPGVEILISDKIDLKIKHDTRDKEGHYIMIKGSIQEENIKIVNIYVPNIETNERHQRQLKQIERYFMFLCRKNYCCENDYTTKCNLQI